MQVNSFSSLRSYFSLLGAKEFRYIDNQDLIYPQSLVERWTNRVLTPLQGSIDYVLKNFNQPVFIVALNVIGVAALTIGLYPDKFFHAVQTVCSPFFNLEPWMLKTGAYTFNEIMITALMVRSIGRLQTKELVAAWNAGQIMPIHLGTRRLNQN